jgi:tetratricopeptide (TPR) repeat protein
MSESEQKILNQLGNARDLYLKGNYPEAIDIYKKLETVLKDDPENLSVILIELGWAFYNNQNYENAINRMEKAIADKNINQQQTFDCYRIIGFCYEMSGKNDLAIKNLESALNIEVSRSAKRYAIFELGKIYFTSGQIVKAQEYLKEANQLFEDSELEYKTALAYYLGFAAYFEKNFPLAQKHFNFVIQRGKDYKTLASGYFGLAHLHYQHKEYEALIDTSEKIMRLDDTFFDKETLGYFLCEAYLNLKEKKELSNFYTELKNSYPKGRYASEYQKYEVALKTPPN